MSPLDSLPAGTEDPMPRPPWQSLLLAYAAMLPIAAGTLGALALAGPIPTRLTIAWAGAVLCFLAGVRRGLSFRQPGGPTVAQLATMFVLFVLGAASLLSPWPIPALLLQLAGYATMAIADPIAARRREAPLYFQHLRPRQMLIPLLSLAILAAHTLTTPADPTLIPPPRRDTMRRDNQGGTPMFTHVMVGSNDLARSKRFYDALFAAIGGQPGTEDHARNRIVYSHDGGRFLVTKPIDGQPATGANGGTIGFRAASPEQADAWHQAGVANGGTAVEDPPGPRGGGAMYIAYLRDPDGNKICALHRTNA